MSSLRLGYYSQASVVLIQAISPLHVGMVRGVGVVDLPVQRDTLGFPTIFASSLKGALRTTFNRRIGKDGACTRIIFGPSEVGEKDYYAGAFNSLDAKLLFLPVRSLVGVYTLTTSPFMLNNFLTYLKAYASVSGGELKAVIDGLEKTLKELKDLGKEEIFVGQEKGKLDLKIADKEVVVLADEFRLFLKESTAIEELSKILALEEGWRVAVVHDDLMVNSLLERGLLRQTRIALDTETKRVRQGALWTEESLPHQTILCTVFFYSNPRTEVNACPDLIANPNATGVKEFFEKIIIPNGHGYIILGGNETVGRGVAKLRKMG